MANLTLTTPPKASSKPSKKKAVADSWDDEDEDEGEEDEGEEDQGEGDEGEEDDAEEDEGEVDEGEGHQVEGRDAEQCFSDKIHGLLGLVSTAHDF